MAPAGPKCLLHDMNNPITPYKAAKCHQTALKDISSTSVHTGKAFKSKTDFYFSGDDIISE